ncbi:MAG: hypothetical protein IJZ34_12550 [Lachnospiraceae bacterium]|nr:hypothetical protein [Lachnospiraceae bacterium]
MAKVYLVDSENIGASWSQLLASMSKEDRMYVFYTDKSPYISYENLLQVIAHCEIPVFLKCYEGKNALDFQLVSELGFKLCQDPTAEFIIVSDDYGYDAAVRYWSERKYNVRRIGKKYCRPILPKKDNIAVQSEVRAIQVEERKGKTVRNAEKTLQPEIIQPVEEVLAAEEPQVIEAVPARESANLEDNSLNSENELSTTTIPDLDEVMNPPVVSEKVEQQSVMEEQSSAEQQIEQPLLEEQTQEHSVAVQVAEEAQTVIEEQAGQETPQKSQKDNQTQKRSRDRRKKHKKEAVKEPDKATGTAAEEDVPEETPTVDEQADAMKQQEAEQADVEAVVELNQTKQPESEEYKLDFQILDMVKRCGSLEPEKDARCVKELFCTLSMSNLTSVNNALTSLIGNELGNGIYRELKEHQECREQLDALYCPAVKNRFIHYVQIVLDRSELESITAEELGNFLLRIPRKNLNSIRSAMMKEFGHDLGAEIYTVFKTHIKVLNKI